MKINYFRFLSLLLLPLLLAACQGNSENQGNPELCYFLLSYDVADCGDCCEGKVQCYQVPANRHKHDAESALPLPPVMTRPATCTHAHLVPTAISSNVSWGTVWVFM